MQAELLQKDRQELLVLIDEYLTSSLYISFPKNKLRVREVRHPTFKGKSTAHKERLQKELLFQLHVLGWALLISEYGKAEVLKRLYEAVGPSGIYPSEQLRLIAIASKYFATQV